MIHRSVCVFLWTTGNNACCFGGIQRLQNGSQDVKLLKGEGLLGGCYTGNATEASTGKAGDSPTKFFPSEAINLLV